MASIDREVASLDARTGDGRQNPQRLQLAQEPDAHIVLPTQLPFTG